MRAWWWCGLVLTTGCLAVPATNPYDPQSPAAVRAKALIQGSAAYPDRADPSGIEVVLLDENGANVLDTRTLGGTTGDAFSFEVESGTYRLRAQGSFYAPAAAGPLEMAPGEQVDVGRLVLQTPPPTASVKGRVEVNGGLAADGVLVTLRLADDNGVCGGVVAQQPTGAGGQFFFGAVTPGAYVVLAQASGATVDASDVVDVPRDAAVELPRALSLQPDTAAVVIEAAGVKPASATRTASVVVHVLPMAGMDEMRVGLDATFGSHGTPAPWTSYAPQTALDLGGEEGLRTVFVQLRRGCLTSPVFSVDVLYDHTAPVLLSVTLNEGHAYLATSAPTVPLTVEASDHSGVRALQVLTGDDDPELTPFTPVDALPGLFRLTTQVSLPLSDGTTRVRVRVRDGAGNETPLVEADVFAATITRDTTPPSAATLLELRAATPGRSALLGVPGSGLDARTNDPRPAFRFTPAPDVAGSPVAWRVELSAGTDFSTLLPLGAAAPVPDEGALRLTAPFALVDGVYRWRVVSQDAAGLLATSATHLFEVDTAGPPAPPYLAVPSPTALPVALRIPPVAGATELDVRVEPIPNAQEPLAEQVTGVGQHVRSVPTDGASFTAVTLDGPRAPLPVESLLPGEITLLPESAGSTRFASYGTFLVTVSARDALGNTGTPRTEVFVLDLTAPAPVLLEGAPPPFTNQDQVTVRLSFQDEVPHLTDPSFLRYEICTQRDVPGVPLCPDVDDWAPASGVDGFVVALVANVGGPAANPSTLNHVCARTRDQAGNLSEASCRLTVLDQVPPASPTAAVAVMDVSGPEALVWLKQQACRSGTGPLLTLCDENPVGCAEPVLGVGALGNRTLVCPVGPERHQVRGGPALHDYVDLPGPPFLVTLEDDATPLLDGPVTTTVEIRAVDAAGNVSQAPAEVSVQRAGSRVLTSLPATMTLRPVDNPRLASTSGVALMHVGPVNPPPGVLHDCGEEPERDTDEHVYLLAQPTDLGPVGLDDKAATVGGMVRRLTLPENNRQDLEAYFAYPSAFSSRQTLGAVGAGGGALSWLEHVHGFVDGVGGGYPICLGIQPVPFAVMAWPDGNGRYDIRSPAIAPWDLIDCQTRGNLRCQASWLAWAPELREAPRESATNGRTILVGGAGATTFRTAERNAPEVAELTVTGPYLVGLRARLRSNTIINVRGANLRLQGVPTGTLLSSGFYVSSEPDDFYLAQDETAGVLAQPYAGGEWHTMPANSRSGPYDDFEELGMSQVYLNTYGGYREDLVVGVIVPSGVTATFPLVPRPDELGPLEGPALVTRRGITGSEETLLRTELSGVDNDPEVVLPPNVDELVPALELLLQDREGTEAGITAVDFGPDHEPQYRDGPRDRWHDALGQSLPPHDDNQQLLLSEPSPRRQAGLGGTEEGPVARSFPCAVVLHPSEDKLVTNVHVPGRGLLDLLELQVWERVDTVPFGEYRRIPTGVDAYSVDGTYLGGTWFKPSDPTLLDCAARAGGCSEAVADSFPGLLLRADRYYVLTLGPEPLTDVGPQPLTWPGDGAQVYQGAPLPDALGVLGTLEGSSDAFIQRQSETSVLQVNTVATSAPVCHLRLELADTVGYQQLALSSEAALAVRVAQQPSGPARQAVVGGTLGPDGAPDLGELTALHLVETGRRLVATAAVDGALRWLETDEQGLSGRVYEVRTTPWPPPVPAQAVLELDQPTDPLRVEHAAFSGDRLAAYGFGAGRTEVRVYALTRDARGGVELTRLGAPSEVRALSLDHDELFLWNQTPATGGQLIHRTLSSLLPLHAGGERQSVGFDVVGETAVTSLCPVVGTPRCQLMELRGEPPVITTLAEGGVRLAPTLLGGEYVASLWAPDAGLPAAPQLRVLVRDRPELGEITVTSADAVLSDVEVSRLSPYALSQRPLLMAEGQLLVVLGWQGETAHVLLLELPPPESADEVANVAAVMPVQTVERAQGLFVAEGKVLVTRSDRGAVLLHRDEGGAWVREDFSGQQVSDGGLRPTRERVVGLVAARAGLPGGLVVLKEPPQPEGRTVALAEVVVRTVDPAGGPGVDSAPYRLPAQVFQHTLAAITRDARGDLLAYDVTATPAVLWRLDRVGGVPLMEAPAHRPLLGTTDLGAAAWPRLGTRGLYFLRGLTSGTGLMRYRR
ncbi:MAG: hypothetical protein AB2A00_19775 [Myxococcota bacterium]